jgi:hypothetical protein
MEPATGPAVVDRELCDGAACRRAGHDGGERRPVLDGRRLCAACSSRLADGVRELPALHLVCGAALGRNAARGLSEKITGGPMPGLAFNDVAAEARARIVATLAMWSGLVADERRCEAPGRQVRPLADFLLANLTWLTAHPAAADMSVDVARTVGIARRAADPEAVKRIVVGPCVVPGCDGALAATVRPDRADRAGRTGRTGRADEEARVRCSTDPGHTWDRHEWTRLRREMGPPARGADERWLGAADIARLWSTTTGTVYRLASEQGWRRLTRAGRTFYAESDVDRCFSRRRSRVPQRG